MGVLRCPLERSQPARVPRPLLAALFTLLLALVTAPAALAGVLVFEGSLEQADYPTGNATTLSPSLAWRSSRWSLSITVPILRQSVGELVRVGPGVTQGNSETDDSGSGTGDDGGNGNGTDGGAGGGDDGGAGNGNGAGDGNGDGGAGGNDGGGGSDDGSGAGDGGNGGSGGDGGNGDGGGNGGNGGNGGDGGDPGGGGGNGGDGNGGDGNGGDGGDGGGGSGGDGGGNGGGNVTNQSGSQTSGEAATNGTGTTERRSETKTGLGDPILRLDVALPGVLGAGIRGGLFGAVKVPLADSDLGTEEWDFGAGVFAWRTGLLTDIYVELGYWVLGDPATYELSDPIAWRAYLTRRLPTGRWAFAALTQGATEVVDGAGTSAELGLWAGRTFSATRSLGLSVTAGLDDAAPDWSATLSWRLGVAGLRPQTGP